ncbi:jg17199 [Pararge aegeria aegeria]|uniref:Jg17199 protein n=1 Tax=Pararge aegeria aegeria TaxID=348720 RepID=A0A8S4S8B0_9NEOP|nr:jg17199 [Pararge aegeria aegeria]
MHSEQINKPALIQMKCLPCMVGEDAINNTKCIPFVSEYSDCTEGCSQCKCNESGQWECKEVFMCPGSEEEAPDQDTIITTIDNIQKYLEENPYEEKFETWFTRQKRSLIEESGEKRLENTTVKFFHTVDEINEDTLKTSNKTGTIEVQKVQANRLPKISRRTDVIDDFNKSTQSALHIRYNQPQDYDRHIAENKIDAASHVASKLDENELQKLIGNHSQVKKDKDLSKLVVNELKLGDEIIGDKNFTPISNITFTPENDTLTAMAFIAGNLLSKLWDMEKDAGDDSIETEVLKHEKINDLLELFKEPLNIRQETFLKNALEKISDSLNKNKSMKHFSICETITGLDMSQGSDETGDMEGIKEAKRNKTKCKQPEHNKQPTKKETQYNITVGVVTKLNNVLGLIKKYENVQEKLKDMKHPISTERINAKGVDKKPSFELFGNLLDKITKLLIPNKSKRVGNKLKKSYQFTNKSNINNIFESKFNINLGKINMTTKDKLVLDYLKHIEGNPDCLFRNNIQRNPNLSMNIEGNILYNLSEFFKVKSLVDLMKLTKSENVIEKNSKSTTEFPNERTSFKSSLRNKMIDEEKQSSSTKDKLKSHLKAIVDDLQHLQLERGVNKIENISIMDIMPCIYKILNTNKVMNDQTLHRSNITQGTHLDKIKNLLHTLKLEIQANLPTRRSNFISQEVPKSAKIWERMIENINNAQKSTRRRFVTEKPKTYEELKDIMEKVELMGNTYKNFALLSEVPPQKRLMLLKTLEADTKQQSIALANIKSSVDTFSLEKGNDIEEFIENVANNLRLSTKVLENKEKTKQMNTRQKAGVKPLFNNENKQALKISKTLNIPKEIVEYKNNNIKLSRDQILNQLIKNRVQLYLKSKESIGADLTDDINYNIGKRILILIHNGNLNVAKELFRIFIANKQKEENVYPKKGNGYKRCSKDPQICHSEVTPSAVHLAPKDCEEWEI